MHILMIAINDPAGTAIAFTKAINKYTDHTCRLITKEIRYNFMFEKDLHLPWLDDQGWEEVEDLLKTSDVFHFHMTADEYIELGPFRPVDYMRGKIIVHHHHGHPDFRGNPVKYREKYRRLGRKAIVSTPDLLKLLPEAVWQPNLVPIHDPDYLPVPEPEGPETLVCHAPTRKDLKNTSEFLRVMKDMEKIYPNISCRLIENMPHRECLRAKQKCQVCFDHMQGYYGVSSLESLSQGKPVIAGIDDWNIRCIKEFNGAIRLPWVVARNEAQLLTGLSNIVDDKQARRIMGEESRIFMESFWTEQQVLERLIATLELL
jgi:glycosyltransferase involved in cell wall biosynthesis